MKEGARHVRHRKCHMAAKGLVESRQTFVLVLILQRLDLVVEIGMRSQRPLRKRNQRPRQDIRAFNRDPHRDHLISAHQIVRRTITNRPPAVNVERVIDRPAQPFGGLVLHQR